MTNRHDWPLALSYDASKFGDDVLSAYQKAGIRYMEFSNSNRDYFTESEYVKNAKNMFTKAKAYDVTISSIHLPFAPFSILDPASTDRTVRDSIVAFQSELMKAAADSGINIAVLHPSGEPYREEERPMRLACAVDTIGRLQKTAQDAGITLALENLPRTCLGRDSSDMLYFLRNIPALSVCFDTNHNLAEPNTAFIHAIGEKIVTLHVSDYDFADEKHWFPTKGKNPWNAIFRALEEVNYNGRFTYEVGFQGGETIEDVAANYAALLL